MSQVWAQNWILPSHLALVSSSKNRPLLLSGMLLISPSEASKPTPNSWRGGAKPRRRSFTPPSCKAWPGEAPLPECASGEKLVSGCGFSIAHTTSCCSITSAFTTMVFMLRSLQSSALQMRQLVRCDEDFQSLLASVQMDMHCSLLWLFQRVFVSTPTLMLTLMIILANYVAFSTSNLERLEEPTQASSSSTSGVAQAPSSSRPRRQAAPPLKRSTSSSDVFISGNLTAGLRNDQVVNTEEEGLLVVSLLEQAAQQHQIENNGRAPHAVEVTLEVVAPVSVQIEDDNYECFDRTEILYQDALNRDRHNPLLLANYAEFLFLVRRDYERAHILFNLALRADPDDAEIISRYAKFVWLVKGDRGAAERAYRAAMAAEPSNPFYAGCYAHFLWHSGDGQAASRIIRSVSDRD